jgi:hypothetical protein
MFVTLPRFIILSVPPYWGVTVVGGTTVVVGAGAVVVGFGAVLVGAGAVVVVIGAGAVVVGAGAGVVGVVLQLKAAMEASTPIKMAR